MLKNILSLNGAQSLSKNEQKSIQGGHPTPWGFGCHTLSQCMSHCSVECTDVPTPTNDGPILHCYICIQNDK